MTTTRPAEPGGHAFGVGEPATMIRWGRPVSTPALDRGADVVAVHVDGPQPAPSPTTDTQSPSG